MKREDRFKKGVRDMFYIRADGNEKIGMGHVMRCLTIAEALRERGEDVLFLTADDKPVKLIEDRGFAVKILFTYYDEMEVELPQLMALFMGTTGGEGVELPRILVDSYFVTEFYLKNLRLSATVILMDDEKMYAKIDDCIHFVEETNIDSLAPALGSVHGIYKGKPKIDFEKITILKEKLQIPLVLHGGTGLNDN